MEKRDLYGPARDVLAAYSSDADAMESAMAKLADALKPVPTPAQMRAAGDIEAADKAANSLIYETARRLVGGEVNLCISWLVSELAKRAYEPESIMDEDDAATLSGRAPDVDDFEEAERFANDGWRLSIEEGEECFSWFAFDSDGDMMDSGKEDSEVAAWRDAFDAVGRDMPEGSEAFEHWAVSRWLAEKLEAKGESVVETDFAGHVWARCTTGQMICMDWVIKQIARDLCAKELTGVDGND